MTTDALRIFQDKNIELELADKPLYVSLDASAVSQMTTNLINNALEATKNSPHPQIRVSVLQSGDNAVLQVSDNGPGVPEELREAIFAPAFTTTSSGNGLGLAVVRGLAQAAGGSAVCQAKEPTGSVFIITLPLVKQ